MTIRVKKLYRISAVALFLSFLLGAAALAFESTEVPLALEPTELDYLALISENVYLIYEELVSHSESVLNYLSGWVQQFADFEEYLKIIYASVVTIEDWILDIRGFVSDMNTNTTKLIIPYLETIAYSLNNSGSSVAMYLESINTKLDTLISNQGSSVGGSSVDLTGIATKLETLISNQSSMLELLQADGAFITDISGIEDALVDLSTDLGTMISNQSDILELLGEESTLYTDGYGILGNLETILGNLETLISNQSDVIDLLGAESTRYADGYGILGNLETLISNQDDILELLQEDGAFTTDISGIQTSLTSLISKLDTVLTNQQAVSTGFSSIESALIYEGVTLGDRLSRISTNLLSLLNKSKRYYESALANQQGVTVLLTDIASILRGDELTPSFTDSINSMRSSMDRLEHELFGGQLEGGILRKLESSAYNLENLVSDIRVGTVDKLDFILEKLGTALINQQIISTNQQETNELLSDIASVLNDDAMEMPFMDLINSMRVSLSNIEDALYNDSGSVFSVLKLFNNNVLSRTKVIISNQEAVIALLEENGTSGVDFSGLLDKQQELIDLIKDLNVTTVEKIENITIEESHEAYDVFYITDSDGNEQNLGEFSGDMLSIGGRLLNFFFRAVFDGTLDSVDTALNDMTGFYIDGSVALEGGSLWD